MQMILLYTLNLIRHLTCGNNQNWPLNLNLIYGTLDSVDQRKKWLFNFSVGKTQLVLFDQSNSSTAINVKTDGRLEKNFSKLLGLYFLFQIGLGLLRFLCCQNILQENQILDSFYEIYCSSGYSLSSINLPNSHTYNTVVTSALVLLVATWNCWIS